MSFRPEDITIAITVYDRRQYLFEAIESALNQTRPVKVMVVEDCGPDREMQAWVVEHFGNRVQYVRNAQNRGLFGNWNACLELCRTPWLSILHDDDALKPGFVATMCSLAEQAPGRSIYFGQAAVQEGDSVENAAPLPDGVAWRDLELAEFAEQNRVLFPGQLFRVDAAREVGGFRVTSMWAGDWEMWFKLAVRGGAAQTAKEVAVCRTHDTPGRGTPKIYRSGRKWALDNVQRKRNLALLRARGGGFRFEREKLLSEHPIPSLCLLAYGATWSRALLKYNTFLLARSRAPHWRYSVFKFGARAFGPSFVCIVSRMWRWMRVLPIGCH